MARTPSLRQRRLAAALKRLREERKLTLAQAVEKVGEGFSVSRLGRVESCVVRINGDDTYLLCQAYEVDSTTRDALVRLAREARRRGWWHVYSDDALGRFVDYLELHSDARSVREFEIDVVPGVLQSARYAEATVRHTFPDAEQVTIDKRVELRANIQAQTRERRVPCAFVVDEAALRRPVGGREVMAEQLDQLARSAREPGVDLQVLPEDISGHGAMGVPFTLLELADGATFVYSDGITGGRYAEDTEDVRAYTQAWSRLQAMALDYDRSATLVERHATAHREEAR